MPFQLPVEITGFGSGLPGVTNRNVVEQFSTGDILRAAVVAGHGGAKQVNWRIQAWRIASIRLALNLPGPSGSSPRPLTHPRAWARLDPSEKASVNNLLGNTVTKLLCERLLDAPRTWFLDLYRSRFSADLAGVKRPDFFTQTRGGQWLSLEAKGRSNRPSAASLSLAKAQANALRRINGVDVAAHVVCWTMARGKSLCVRFHDPAPSGQGEITVEPQQLVRDYYAPVHEVMEASHEERHPSGATLYQFDAGDFKIGLHPNVEAELRAGQQRIKKSEHVFDAPDNTSTAVPTLKYGPDGVVVVPGESWPDE